MLRTGQLLPGFTLRTPDGRTVRAWDFKQKRSVVIAFLHGDCAACREYLEQLARFAVDFAAQDAAVLAVFSGGCAPALAVPLAAGIVVGTETSGRGARAYLGGEAGAVPTCESLGVFIADRYGELKEAWSGASEDALPGPSEILRQMAQIEIASEECGGIA